MMSKNILLVGGGGHCKSVLDCILTNKQFEKIGIVDLAENIGMNILGIPILGEDDDLRNLYSKGFQYAFVTLGSVGNSKPRRKLFQLLEEIGFTVPNIIDASACLSPRLVLGKGIFIGKKAIVNVDSKIGTGVILNTGCLVEHECIVEDFSHIAPGSVLCGSVHIGKDTHIGASSVVKQQITIGSNTIIGMGSVVLHDIAADKLAYGNPCKEVG